MTVSEDKLLRELRVKGVTAAADKERLQSAGFGYDPLGRYWFATPSPRRRELVRQLGAGSSPKQSTAPTRRRAAPTPRAERPTPNGRGCAAQFELTADIHTDKARFQHREADYSQESVERIIQDFDPNRMDPIVAWRDPRNGKAYVLSGHSRLKAHQLMQRPYIAVRWFDGTEAEAIQFGKGLANRLATAESLAEDVQTYRLFRDGNNSQGIAPATREQLRQMFGSRVDRLERLSYLSPVGRFMQALRLPKAQQDQIPYLVRNAEWVGEWRKTYGNKLTNIHEEELFDFLVLQGAKGLKKEDLQDRLNRKVGAMWWNPDNRLGLDVEASEAESRADTGPAAMRLREIGTELARLQQVLKSKGLAKETKSTLEREASDLLAEKARIERDINQVVRTQQGLFGSGKGKRRKQQIPRLSNGATPADAIQALRQAGFVFDRQEKGSHERYIHEPTGVWTVVPFHGGRELSNIVRRSINDAIVRALKS